MIKVISFELKKLVSRIGTYVLVLALAGLLVAGVFMYDPIKSKDNTISLVGETVTDMYSSFNNEFKNTYVDMIEGVAEDASTYIKKSSQYSSLDKVTIDGLFEKFDEYCLLYNEASATTDEYNTLLVGINSSLENLKSTLDEALEYSQNKTGYYILSTTDNYKKLFGTLNDIILNFDSPISHKYAGERYYNEYRGELVECLNNLIYPSLSDTAQKYAKNGTYYSLITMRMDEIITKMENEYNKVLEDSIYDVDVAVKKELNVLFNRYVNSAEIFAKAYTSSMSFDALSSVKSKTDKANLVGYANVSIYEQKENATKYQYYIENNASEKDYANSFSITHTSNGETNAYDFTFFVMSLFSVVVVIFAIYLSANTISGEINNNTMRLVSLRPVNRGSLFMGKYISIIIMSILLLLFGAITSFVVGGILFGFSCANVLMIINGSFVIVSHPAVVLGIFVLNQLLLIVIYSAISIMLSSLIKSDLLSMIIGVVLYAVNLILPLFFGATSWLKFYPFTNINLFAYFGSNHLTSDSVLAKLFNPIVYHGMNMWISLIYVVGIPVLMLAIGKMVFKKREL